jgi:hypothetical protein
MIHPSQFSGGSVASDEIGTFSPDLYNMRHQSLLHPKVSPLATSFRSLWSPAEYDLVIII